MKIVLSIVLVSIINLYAQDESILKLFPGKWKMDIENAEIFEEWEVVNDNELIGKSYSVKNGENILSETIYIKKFADIWAYVAIPQNQSIALFELIEHASKKFVFENKEHDFPQRIIYEFHKDEKFTAAIEGNVNGKSKRKEFSFKFVEE